MQFDIFSAHFWEDSAWQGIGVIVTIFTCVMSPFLSTFVDRLFNKKEQDQQYINAYKALLLPEGSMSIGETLFFIPIQIAASYGFYLLVLRIWLIYQIDTNTWLDLSFLIVFIVTWGLSIAKRKSLAKLLTWQFSISMIILCLLLAGDKKDVIFITKDFTFVKHVIGQYVPADIKQWSLVITLRNLHLNAIPIDLKVASPLAARTQFIWIYGFTLAFFLFCYALYKRHYANRVSAFAYLSEKKRREAMELLKYQKRQADLELKVLAKQEKEVEIELKKEQITMVIEKEKLALEKGKLEVESSRLDLEKKRVQYMLELATLLIDTLYNGGDTVDIRAELLRNTLPAFKDFGHKDSNTIILDHIQSTQQQPIAIPAIVV